MYVIKNNGKERKEKQICRYKDVKEYRFDRRKHIGKYFL